MILPDTVAATCPSKTYVAFLQNNRYASLISEVLSIFLNLLSIAKLLFRLSKTCRTYERFLHLVTKIFKLPAFLCEERGIVSQSFLEILSLCSKNFSKDFEMPVCPSPSHLMQYALVLFSLGRTQVMLHLANFECLLLHFRYCLSVKSSQPYPKLPFTLFLLQHYHFIWLQSVH